MRLALLLTTLAALTLHARPAAACSCVSFPNALDYAKDADVVFEGVLESIVLRGFRSESAFSVERVWKGQVTTSISIDTAGTECDHLGIHDTFGLQFALGARYLVFAKEIWSECRPTANCVQEHGARPRQRKPSVSSEPASHLPTPGVFRPGSDAFVAAAEADRRSDQC